MVAGSPSVTLVVALNQASLKSSNLTLLVEEPVLVGQHTWREDTLTDVLSVVLHAREGVLLDHGGATGSLFQNWVHHVVIRVNGLPHSLGAAERVEGVVRRAITLQEGLVVVELFGGPADVGSVLSVARDALVLHRVRVRQVDCRASVDKAILYLEVASVHASVRAELNLRLRQLRSCLIEAATVH